LGAVQCVHVPGREHDAGLIRQGQPVVLRLVVDADVHALAKVALVQREAQHVSLGELLYAPHPCKIRRLPLDCHCNSGANRLYRRGTLLAGSFAGMPAVLTMAGLPGSASLKIVAVAIVKKPFTSPGMYTVSKGSEPR
jgi:hypothetical protein